MVISDTVWQDFDAETLAGMSDSKILSKFTSGFFGGICVWYGGYFVECWSLESTACSFYKYDPTLLFALLIASIWNLVNNGDSRLYTRRTFA